MKINLHTHTARCNHAVGTEREYIERAIAAGLTTMGFSDHAPMPFRSSYYSSFRMKPDKAEDYVETLIKLREEYKNDIRILIGFEVEYYPALFQDFLQFISPYPIDYLLLGQHYLFNEENAPYCGMAIEDESLLEQYVSQVTEGLQTGMFTYLAHPDLLRFTGSDTIYEKHMRRLCENALALDVPLEINCLGLWDHRNYPSDRFFRIAGEVGNRVVIGLDAHQGERIVEKEHLQSAHAMIERWNLTLTEDIRLRRPHTL